MDINLKILVIGCGKMGSVIAWDLCRYAELESVGLVDNYAPSLENTTAWIQDKRVTTHLLGSNSREQLIALMKSYDVGIGALPMIRQTNQLIEMAVEAEMNLVDIYGEYYRRPNEAYLDGFNIPSGVTGQAYGEMLHQQALDKDITILCCMGFAPGLSNMTLGHGIAQMDSAHTAIARVGGIPDIEVAHKYPMKYMVTWCWDQAIDSAMDKTRILKDGTFQYVNAMSEYERFSFNAFGKDLELEAFITPGMESFLFTRPELESCYEKTIRWPGYKDSMSFLKSCGFFDKTPIRFNNTNIVPRELAARIMEPELAPKNGDVDVSIMWNTVTGEKDGKFSQIDYYMWVDSDSEHNISSMARATGFPASISAVLMARGNVVSRGIVSPEEAFDRGLYRSMVDELETKGVVIKQSTA
jgi:saccharopine dehydrogenase-like NADP-dependent oxidoreductase